jgi:hypothetical protein
MDKKFWKIILWAMPRLVHKWVKAKTGMVLLRCEDTETHRVIGYRWITVSEWEALGKL